MIVEAEVIEPVGVVVEEASEPTKEEEELVPLDEARISEPPEFVVEELNEEIVAEEAAVEVTEEVAELASVEAAVMIERG